MIGICALAMYTLCILCYFSVSIINIYMYFLYLVLKNNENNMRIKASNFKNRNFMGILLLLTILPGCTNALIERYRERYKEM